jgi:cyclohexanecarboxyl-CoA dehydrogenase
MEFGLNEDQEAFRDTVRTFARGKLAPGYLERAKSERFPWDAHREVAALGVFGLLAGGEFSPLDHEDYVAAGLVVEELAYADFNLANAAIPVLLMSSLIARHGQDELRRDWLPGLVGGDTYVALGLTEPGTGSDVTAIRTTATATADGYVLRGEKTSVTMLAHAAAIIVVAQTVRASLDETAAYVSDRQAFGSQLVRPAARQPGDPRLPALARELRLLQRIPAGTANA